MKEENLQTVVETPEFIKQVAGHMDDETRNEFVNYIAKNPCLGD